MESLTARPQLLKQANLALIRRVIKTKGTATRAEIAAETKISSTTVRSLLAEMMQNGEIESIGYDASSGGRKAERYGFQPDRYHSAAFCITDNQVHSLIVNICGEIVEAVPLQVQGDDFEQAVTGYLDQLTARREIKSIGIGVPGVVEGNAFWRKDEHSGELYRVDMGERLAQKYGIPVILENDLKATAIGFMRGYEKNAACEDREETNMAYLYFEKGCVSAGFIAGGRIIRGQNNFAGELGLIPVDGGKLVDDYMSEPMDEERYIVRVAAIAGWICGILNPQYIALSGPDLRKNCAGPIGERLSSLLPEQMRAEILCSPDVWRDYHEGMAYLTAGRMFDEIQFIKE